MARITKVLTAINEVCGPFLIPDEESHQASVFIDGAADGSVVLEVSGQDDGANPPVDQWVVSGMTPMSQGATVLLLTGSGVAQGAYASIGAAKKVRVRKSVAGTGPMRVTLSTGSF